MVLVGYYLRGFETGRVGRRRPRGRM